MAPTGRTCREREASLRGTSSTRRDWTRSKSSGPGTATITLRVHVATLPGAFRATFAHALPVIARGGYLSTADMPAARNVLRAAAWTYVVAALATLLDVARWL